MRERELTRSSRLRLPKGNARTNEKLGKKLGKNEAVVVVKMGAVVFGVKRSTSVIRSLPPAATNHRDRVSVPVAMVTATAFGVHRRNYATRRELYANELSLGAIRRHFSETRGAWTRSQSATAAPGDAANGQVTPTNQPTRKQRRRASRIRIDSQDVFDRELLARRTTTTTTTTTTATTGA